MNARRGARKLVLAVIDALDPAGFERAIEEGQAPALGALMEHGAYVPDCVSSFPSITPVAAGAPDRSATPGPERKVSMPPRSPQ